MSEKHPSIRLLLSSLSMQANRWIVIDHWSDDLCAIGIACENCPRRLVYVSTYGKDDEKYDFVCEIPNGPNPEDYLVSDEGENVTRDVLGSVIEKHLAGRDDLAGGAMKIE